LDNSDEELYRALMLEQRLSAEDPSALAELSARYFPYTLSEVVTRGGEREWGYIKLRGRSHIADPLHPVTIIMLVLWIPVNIVYLTFQALRNLAATNSVIQPLHNGSARILPPALELTAWGNVMEILPYHEISLIGYHPNGLRINRGRRKLVVDSPNAPSLFIALTHLAPAASIESGLIVPDDFLIRCQEAGWPLDPGSMRRNPPASWKAAASNFKPPIPLRRIVAYFIIVVLALALLPIILGK